MWTPRFWPTVDRLGTFGCAQIQWRSELDGGFAEAARFLKTLPGLATDIPDPDDPRHRLSIHSTDEDDIFSAESDDLPAHRAPIEVCAADLTRLAPDIEKVSDALADAVGFTPRQPCTAHCPNIWQVGIVQPRLKRTLPVYLYLPTGHFSDFDSFRAGLQSLTCGILYLPTNRLIIPEITNLAQTRGVALESIHDRLRQDSAGATSAMTAIAASTSTGRKTKTSKRAPILPVERGWKWEKLSIRLSLKGHLTARYAQHVGHYDFGYREGIDGNPKHPPQFTILYRMCAQGWWKNPPTYERGYQSTQREFSRLRETLTDLIAIAGSPFEKRDGIWKPRFQFEADADLAKSLAKMVQENPTERMAALRNRRSPDDLDEGESE
jgi:hypothetical protein